MHYISVNSLWLSERQVDKYGLFKDYDLVSTTPCMFDTIHPIYFRIFLKFASLADRIDFESHINKVSFMFRRCEGFTVWSASRLVCLVKKVRLPIGQEYVF